MERLTTLVSACVLLVGMSCTTSADTPRNAEPVLAQIGPIVLSYPTLAFSGGVMAPTLSITNCANGQQHHYFRPDDVYAPNEVRDVILRVGADAETWRDMRSGLRDVPQWRGSSRLAPEYTTDACLEFFPQIVEGRVSIGR